MQSLTFYVIAYDIADDRRRAKIAKLMESLGFRVQGSVFEGYLTDADVKRMVKKADKIMEAEEDSIRVYMICEACLKKMILIGNGTVTKPPGPVII